VAAQPSKGLLHLAHGDSRPSSGQLRCAGLPIQDDVVAEHWACRGDMSAFRRLGTQRRSA
jgi:hypothetical protein